MSPNQADALHTLSVVAARWQAILDTTQDAIICIAQDGEIYRWRLERNGNRKLVSVRGSITVNSASLSGGRNICESIPKGENGSWTAAHHFTVRNANSRVRLPAHPRRHPVIIELKQLH